MEEDSDKDEGATLEELVRPNRHYLNESDGEKHTSEKKPSSGGLLCWRCKQEMKRDREKPRVKKNKRIEHFKKIARQSGSITNYF